MPENTSIGADIITVQAIDTDVGSNGAVRYRIRPDPLGSFRNFAIDQVSGILTLTQELDRESQKIYELRIEAYDLGVPTALQSDLDLKIYVKNVNDHEPQFVVEEFIANFTEHRQPGSERVKIVNTIDRDDDDEDSEILDVCYFVMSGDGPKGLFAIHPTNHELMTTKELDRERRSVYNIVIKATEECLNPLDEQDAYNDTTDSSMLKIKIYVNDIDDNPPLFTHEVFTGGIATDNDYGSVIMTVHADDADIDAILEYSVIGNIVSSANSENLEDIKRPPFLLDMTTGDIVLNFDPQKGMKGYFAFHVSVSDMFGHIDKATVQIYLLREDQRVKFVVRSQPSEIRAQMDKFRHVLAKVTNSIVNVDNFIVHEDDHTKTDVLLHFVHPGDNTVMEVDQVLRMIDYKTEELDPIFKEFNVLHTEGVDPTYVKAMTQETVIILWLIGINVFQVILIILILFLCYNQRQKYRRRMKAATIGKNIISDTLLKRKGSPEKSIAKEFVPNTNKHATEGSNPVWMTAGVAYDNMTFEEDEDDLDDNVIERLQRDNNLDSLDANVLNQMHVMVKGNTLNSEEDIGYAASNFSVGDGSTIRVGSSMTKMLMSESSPPSRSQPRSRSSESSGLGSGSSRKHFMGGLFPTQMPPVERLGMESANSFMIRSSNNSSATKSKKKAYGYTTYDDDNIPRTEL